MRLNLVRCVTLGLIFGVSLTSYAGNPNVMNIMIVNASDYNFINCKYNGNPFHVNSQTMFKLPYHAIADPFWKYSSENDATFLAGFYAEQELTDYRKSTFHDQYQWIGLNYTWAVDKSINSWITTNAKILPGGSFSRHSRYTGRHIGSDDVTIQCTVDITPYNRPYFQFIIHKDKTFSWDNKSDVRIVYHEKSSNSYKLSTEDMKILAFDVDYINPPVEG